MRPSRLQNGRCAKSRSQKIRRFGKTCKKMQKAIIGVVLERERESSKRLCIKSPGVQGVPRKPENQNLTNIYMPLLYVLKHGQVKSISESISVFLLHFRQAPRSAVAATESRSY
jgi:hypothetical protein